MEDATTYGIDDDPFPMLNQYVSTSETKCPHCGEQNYVSCISKAHTGIGDFLSQWQDNYCRICRGTWHCEPTYFYILSEQARRTLNKKYPKATFRSKIRNRTRLRLRYALMPCSGHFASSATI